MKWHGRGVEWGFTLHPAAWDHSPQTSATLLTAVWVTPAARWSTQRRRMESQISERQKNYTIKHQLHKRTEGGELGEERHTGGGNGNFRSSCYKATWVWWYWLLLKLIKRKNSKQSTIFKNATGEIQIAFNHYWWSKKEENLMHQSTQRSCWVCQLRNGK